MDIWLNDVEDILSMPGLKDKYISRLHDIDVELERRGISVAQCPIQVMGGTNSHYFFVNFFTDIYYKLVKI